jgi:hypothetical protein
VTGPGEITVIHLVWAPLGEKSLRQFLGSYHAHPAGLEHRLLIVYNGFYSGDDERLRACRAALGDTTHEDLVLDRPVIDLEGYRQAALTVSGGDVCILNSHSRVRSDGWLSLLRRARRQGIGMAGASGSYESTYSSALPWRKPLLRHDFPPFPNPHLRTNGFLIDRDLLLSLYREPITSKRAALRLENGRQSMTRLIAELGDEVRVVGRDGAELGPEQWPDSGGFRSGTQENLLVADNRSDQFDRADPRLRQILQRKAWGHAVSPDHG